MRTRAIVLAVLVGSGCTTVRDFNRSVEGKRWALPYSAGSELAEEKTGGSLRLSKVTMAVPLPPMTTARATERFYLPLLIVNAYHEKFEYRLGGAQLAEDPGSFIRSTLVEELRRGSRHPLVEGPADLELEVTVTRMEAFEASSYWATIVLLYTTASGESGQRIGPACARIEADVVLRGTDGTERLLRVEGVSQVDVLPSPPGQPDYVQVPPALVEAFARAVRGLNLAIVAAIDAPPVR